MSNLERKGFFVGTVTGVIILGALGSGLWSLLEFPLARLANWTLTVVTLNVASVRDDVYRRAAEGLHETAATMGVAFLIALLLTLTLLVAITALAEIPRVAAASARAAGLFSARLMKISGTVLIVGVLFAVSIIFTQFLMLTQENRIATVYRQDVTIVRPYVSESDYQRFESTFARMKSKDDFARLLSELKAIGKRQGIEMPPAVTW